MAADAIRSRLDSQAPEVTVKLSVPPWEPLAWTNTGMPCNTRLASQVSSESACR